MVTGEPARAGIPGEAGALMVMLPQMIAVESVGDATQFEIGFNCHFTLAVPERGGQSAI